MGTRSALAVAAILSCAGAVRAQAPQTPPPPPVIAGSFKGGGSMAGVRYIRLQTPQERDFYWRDTTDRGSYLRIAIPGYTRLFDQLAAQSARSPADGSGLASVASGCRVTGRDDPKFLVVESKDRFTAFYKSQSDKAALAITRWAYHDAGAELVVVEDFLNGKVGGARATFSLLVDPAEDTAVWKATWLAGLVQYEVYEQVKLTGKGGEPVHPLESFRATLSRIACR